MGPAIGADSLSSLTSLASDPPLYPNNTALRNGPITLYIARVPGSKDVFLTSLKPLQKIVTASDVENCLYYLHAHTPADESLLATTNNDIQEPVREPQLPVRDLQLSSEPNSVRNSGVKRKALPAPSGNSTQTGIPLDSHPLPPIPPYPLDENWPTKFNASQLPPRTSQRPPYPDNEYRRRAPSAPSAPYPDESNWPGTHPAQYVSPSTSPPKQGASRYEPFVDDEFTPPPLPPRRSTLSLDSEYSQTWTQSVTELTLIRRHPATGEQWNVADITDPPVYEVEPNSMPGHRIRKPGQPLYIDIKTAGYSKFLQGGQNSFNRRLWMEGSIFENWQSDHRHSRSSESFNSSLYAPQSNLESRNNTDYAVNSMGLRGDPNVHRLSVDSTKKRSKTKSYTFTSPWNGRCEFMSANMGTSLKCRHTLPSTGLAVDQMTPTTVSELRFNLPTGTGASRPQSSSSQPRESRLSKFHFHRKDRSRESLSPPPQGHRRGYSDSPSISSLSLQRSNDDRSHDRRGSYDDRQSYGNTDSRLDLSLGQERAGGGFAGKQVKLGKLIVEYEGLKMLDLVVAANMALWWRAYEKTL